MRPPLVRMPRPMQPSSAKPMLRRVSTCSAAPHGACPTGSGCAYVPRARQRATPLSPGDGCARRLGGARAGGGVLACVAPRRGDARQPGAAIASARAMPVSSRETMGASAFVVPQDVQRSPGRPASQGNRSVCAHCHLRNLRIVLEAACQIVGQAKQRHGAISAARPAVSPAS